MLIGYARVADSSFPSDHMTVFGGISLTLLFDCAVAWSIITLLAGLCVAWARVVPWRAFPTRHGGCARCFAWRICGVDTASLGGRKD
jgi:uncharacterized iron-regulated membrane protein